jgi:hypothetical protein
MFICIKCKCLKVETEYKKTTGNYRLKVCRECDPKAKRVVHKICDHGIRLSKCLKCEGGGSEMCSHLRQKHNCRECRDPVKIRVKHMVFTSRQSDIKKGRYDADKIIDREYVENLIKESEMICTYCGCDMILDKFSLNLATIDRIDNTQGHNKGNVCISCFKCNISQVNNQILAPFIS